MGLAEILLLALGLGADACAAAMSNSMRFQEMPPRRIVAESICFGGMQGLMPVLGFCAGVRFYHVIAAFDHVLALVLLTAAGGRMLWECRQQEPDMSGESFSARFLFLQSIAVSIDALTAGIGFSAFADFSVLPAAGIIAAVTAVLTAFGAAAGKKAGAALQTKAQAAGGLLLIALGIKIFLAHTLFQ